MADALIDLAVRLLVAGLVTTSAAVLAGGLLVLERLLSRRKG